MSESPQGPTQSPQDVYARRLISHRGYPLWIPEPYIKLPKVYQDNGLRIGDVGLVVPEVGCFEVLFNICLPTNHRLHRTNGVPKNFTPVDLNETDVAVYDDVEGEGCVISTSSVTQAEVETIEQGSDYKFSLSSGEGALLILPQGADQHTLRRCRRFGEYAKRHAVEWYKFVEEELERTIDRDSLYLITGFFKTRSWALASFQETASTGEFSAQFKVTHAARNNATGVYSWKTSRPFLSKRAGPKTCNTKSNQTVYISGFKIAITDAALGRKQVSVTTEAPISRSQHEEFTDVVEDIEEQDGTTGSESTSTNQGNSTNQGRQHIIRRVSIQHTPQVSKPFHPSDLINQWLLRKEGSATIAITHDSQWSTLLKSGLLRPEDFLEESRLEEALSEKYTVAVCDGAVHLQTISRRKYKDTPSPGYGDLDRNHSPLDILDETESETQSPDLTPLPLAEPDLSLVQNPDSPQPHPQTEVSCGTTSTDSDYSFLFNDFFAPVAAASTLEAPTSSFMFEHPMGSNSLPEAISSNTTTNNSSEFLSTPQCCLWMENQMGALMPCGAPITGGTVARHLAIHGIPSRGLSGQMIVCCAWLGCGATVRRVSIIRHVREVHLGLSRKTNHC